jgi:outer membrane receptor for ferrienterochelin and colicin
VRFFSSPSVHSSFHCTGPAACSAAMAVWISVKAATTEGVEGVAVVDSRQARTWAASSTLSCATSQRGDSGRKKIYIMGRHISTCSFPRKKGVMGILGSNNIP